MPTVNVIGFKKEDSLRDANAVEDAKLRRSRSLRVVLLVATVSIGQNILIL